MKLYFMTDFDVLSQVLSCIDPSGGRLQLIRRNGSVLLGLPEQSEAATRALRLYQPQRAAARAMVGGLRLLVAAGLHGRLPGKWSTTSRKHELMPPLANVIPGTCGVMLGSPEHRIQRAIASYRTSTGWEVAKIAFGADGSTLLGREALSLEILATKALGVPGCHGLHRGEGLSLLRMPYLTGRAIPSGDHAEALALLSSWVSDRPSMPSANYAEWNNIEIALGDFVTGKRLLEHLASFKLKPVICHGDFARWNLLKQTNGELMVLDWEWGHEQGMPGIDLVHYFLQDARLVSRMSARSAIESTIRDLSRPECRVYLEQTGWSGDPLLPIIACLAYKQGAGHQDNKEMLEEILNFGFTTVPQTGHEAS